MSEAIFPLPLSVYEEFMLADDRPAYPMNFFCRLRWLGRIDRPALEAALRRALPRHPLLSAIVQRRGRHRFEWIAADSPLPPVEWLAKPPGNPFPHATAIDLFRQTGLRIWILQDTAATDVVLQFHHATCDGIGALRFISDLFVSYAAATATTAPPASLRTVAASRLLDRNNFGLTRPAPLRIAAKQCWGFLRLSRFLIRGCVPLVAHQPDPIAKMPPLEYPTALVRELDENESTKLVQVAEQLGVAVNDVLVRDLLLTLADWRNRHRQKDRRGWLRLSLPVSLRNLSHRWLPAANVVGVVFVERREVHCTERRKLLAGIHRELDRAKRWQLGMSVLLLMEAYRFLTGGLVGMTPAAHCRATSGLMNLGSHLKTVPLPRRNGRIVAGNLELEGLDLLVPLRPGTCINMAAYEYAGKRIVMLHYDSRVLSADQAEALLTDFMQSIRESIRSAS